MPKHPYETLYGTGEEEWAQQFSHIKEEAMVNSKDRPKLSFCQMVILALQNATYGLSENDPYGLATCSDICLYINKTFPYYTTRPTGVVSKLILFR